jgi:exosortase
LSLTKEEYTYILLIPCISAAAVFWESRAIKQISRFAYVAGALIFVCPVLLLSVLYAWSDALSSDVQLAIQMGALVLSWVGGFVLCLGLRALKSALFPLVLMFGIVPLPQRALEIIVNQLQQGSAMTATALFWFAGVPVVREGTVMTIPGLTLLVAPECSSIRSTSLLFVTVLTLAQFLLNSRWHRALVVCVAVLLSIVKNGLRIFTIAMLGTSIDPKYLTGSLHHQGGILFFALAMTAVLLLLFILRRREQRQPRLDVRQSQPG